MKILILFAVLFLCFGCGHEEGGEDVHGHEDKAVQDHGHLHVDGEKEKLWELETDRPRYRTRVDTLRLPGVVTLDNRTTFEVNSRIGGIVSSLRKDVGDTVQKGEILCVLNSLELLELKTNYVKAYQRYSQLNNDYDRARELLKLKAIEKKSFLERESAFRMAMAEHLSLAAKLEAVGYKKNRLLAVQSAIAENRWETVRYFLTPNYRIYSPGGGKVIRRQALLGEKIESERTIFEISDTGKVWGILDALEVDLSSIKKGIPVVVSTDAYPRKRFEGRVITIMESLDPQVRTMKVRAEVDNDGGYLKPNMYVTGLIERGGMGEHLSVPAEALVKLKGAEGVFIRETDGYAFQPVEILDRDPQGFIFIDGLSELTRVVIKGVSFLKAEWQLQQGQGADAHAGHTH